MTLWGKEDKSGDAPKFQVAANTTSAVSGQDVHANSTANTIYIDTTAGQPNAVFGVYGVDTTEAGVTSVPHSGWVQQMTYTDMHGRTRVKQEVLVATGTITGDAANTGEIANTTGTVDDSIFPDV